MVPLLVGSIFALAGGYWDDAWHTERGRDDFFIAPHIAIYGGIALAGAALSLWVVLAVRRQGTAALRHAPLALALVAVAATLLSAPIDNAWHVAFGRDSVIWSPPHALGIVGTAALGVALLVELAHGRAGWSRSALPVTGAFVLAALTFLVVEYETDVPQFDVVWYLPVLGLTGALALAIVRRAGRRRWAATEAAAVQLGFVAAVCVLLLGLDFDAAKLPLLIGPALVLDLGADRAAVWLQALGFTAALYLLYPPTLAWAGEGVELSGQDILIGLPLTFVAVLTVLGAVLGDMRPLRLGPAQATALLALCALGAVAVGAPRAVAHDPGQGANAGRLSLVASSLDKRVTLTATLPPTRCQSVDSARIVVRRAGMTRAAGMRREGCRLRGTLTVPQEGRWFVYAELDEGRRRVESWLPLKIGDRPAEARDDERYAYVPADSAGSATKVIVGIALYVLMIALLAFVVRLVRATFPLGRTPV